MTVAKVNSAASCSSTRERTRNYCFFTSAPWMRCDASSIRALLRSGCPVDRSSNVWSRIVSEVAYGSPDLKVASFVDLLTVLR